MVHTIATTKDFSQNPLVCMSPDTGLGTSFLDKQSFTKQAGSLKSPDLNAATTRSLCIDETTIKRLTKEPAPQGILAEVDLPSLRQLDQVFEESVIVLIDPYHPGNLGALMRTALCLNWPNVIVCGSKSVDVFNYQTVRASKGAIASRFLRIYKSSDWHRIYPLIKHHIILAAEEPNEKSKPLDEVIKILRNSSQPVSLVLGNESRGISKDVIKDCTLSISIPSRHLSLNLAVAGGILMHSLCPFASSRVS